MNLDFTTVLATLGRGAAFQIARAARAAGDYLFNSLMPDREQFGYSVESGNMTIHPTMPGLVGMDSPYPPMGSVEVSTFLERSAKIAGEVPMTEQALRHLQDMLMRLGGGAAATNERLLEETLGFLSGVIIQPHLDVREWLKGQALAYGAIDWTFNGKNLAVDYGIPAANKLANRTGTSAYHSTASKFWDDVYEIRRKLRRYSQVRILAHPDTIDAARANKANAMATVADGDGGVTFHRFAEGATGPAAGTLSNDVGDIITLISYGLEGEVLGADGTKVLPFLPPGKLIGVGLGRKRGGYTVGQGAGTDPNAAVALGYGHVAPTVEGGGQPGLWADLFTPEREPWSLVGRGAQNFLPVIEDEKAIVIATTAMP